VVRVRVVHGALKKCAVSQTKKSKKKLDQMKSRQIMRRVNNQQCDSVITVCHHKQI
jgi:hypothetical protein